MKDPDYDLVRDTQIASSKIPFGLVSNLSKLSGRTDISTVYAILAVLTKTEEIDALSQKILNDLLTTARLTFPDEIAAERNRLDKAITSELKQRREMQRQAKIRHLAEKNISLTEAAKQYAGKMPAHERKQIYHAAMREVDRILITSRDKQISLIDKIQSGLGYDLTAEENDTLEEIKSYGLVVENKGLIQTRLEFTDKERVSAVRERIVNFG